MSQGGALYSSGGMSRTFVAATPADLSSVAADTLATSVTAYPLSLADAGSVIEATSASPVTITVPANASVAFPVGTIIEVLQYGAGQVTIAPASGVTLRTASSLTTRARCALWSACRRRQQADFIRPGADKMAIRASTIPI